MSEYPETKKFQSFDPRPKDSRQTSQKEINNFLVSLQNLPYESNWEAVPIHYDDYELSEEKDHFYYKGDGFEKQEISRKSVLKLQIREFIRNLHFELYKYEKDVMTNEHCYHITGNENQSSSEIWHNIRRYRVTASWFKIFSSCTNDAIKNLWSEKSDISNLAQVQWGIKYESTALQKYNERYSDPVEKCGIFFCKKIPFLAASPDGIDRKNCLVVEVKCPYSIRDSDPNINPPNFC